MEAVADSLALALADGLPRETASLDRGPVEGADVAAVCRLDALLLLAMEDALLEVGVVVSPLLLDERLRSPLISVVVEVVTVGGDARGLGIDGGDMAADDDGLRCCC